jgi:tetratricopeptide (TPR) repeat protein
MKISRCFLLPLLATSLMVLFSGCGSVQVENFGNTPRTAMKPHQARKALVESLGHLADTGGGKMKNISVQHDRATYQVARKGVSAEASLVFATVNNLSLMSSGHGYYTVLMNGLELNLGTKSTSAYARFDSSTSARMFIDALLNLKKAALIPDTEEDDFSYFSAHAQIWLLASPKPKMTDDALTSKAVAEDAFKRRDYAAALAGYVDALRLYPMWPEGHYNAALLAAEAEDFQLAAKHMRRYLVLAPEAKDAAEAKEKFLLWQHKATE